MTAICKNLFRAIAFECELYQVLALLSRDKIYAAVIVKGRFSQKDISIAMVTGANVNT